MVPVACQDRGEPLRDGCRIAHDRDAYAPGERREALALGLPDEWEADQDVVEARICEHLRLAELLARDPARARVDLEPSDLRQLVRLDVRPQGDPVLVAVRLHARDVSLDRVEVDGERRALELV